MTDYPKVTKEDIENNIEDIEIQMNLTKGGQVLRWAIITTKSGFAVTGDPSASVSPENDDPELGTGIAIANARNKLWQFMGYELKQRIYNSKV
jgi:hypothetical protein